MRGLDKTIAIRPTVVTVGKKGVHVVHVVHVILNYVFGGNNFRNGCSNS